MATCTPYRHRLWTRGDKGQCLDCNAFAVRLIGAGWAITQPAGNLEPGMLWIFNYGSEADVLAVAHNGPWVTITTRSHSDGKEYTQRKRATTPVVARWPKPVTA